jgi:hypothetical protein
VTVPVCAESCESVRVKRSETSNPIVTGLPGKPGKGAQSSPAFPFLAVAYLLSGADCYGSSLSLPGTQR